MEIQWRYKKLLGERDSVMYLVCALFDNQEYTVIGVLSESFAQTIVASLNKTSTDESAAVGILQHVVASQSYKEQSR